MCSKAASDWSLSHLEDETYMPPYSSVLIYNHHHLDSWFKEENLKRILLKLRSLVGVSILFDESLRFLLIALNYNQNRSIYSKIGVSWPVDFIRL